MNGQDIYKALTDAYYAGFFDGEGCVYIASIQMGGFRLYVSTSQIVDGVLDDMAAEYGGHVYAQIRAAGSKNRDIYNCVISRRRAAIFLQRVLPFLKVKKEQALVALEFDSRYQSKRKITTEDDAFAENCKQKLQALKKQAGGRMMESER